jgi:hypothetical protein
MAKTKRLEFTNVKVNLRIPLGMPSRLAHHLSVQDLGEIVQLSFYEIVFPQITPETSDDEIEAIQSGGLLADCVSKINVPKSRYKEFVEALSTVVEIKQNV